MGSGKTHLLACIEDELTRAGRVAVSRSLAVEKARVTLSTLIEALFYDLGDKNVVIPKPPEKRERELRDLVRKARRPVVLIVDEAQDLHPKTLTGLKRLMEVVAGGGGLLSMLLAAHPKLRIDLRRPDMEQVGYRTSVFEYDGVAGHQRDYMAWLLAACAEDGVKVADVIDADTLWFSLKGKMGYPDPGQGEGKPPTPRWSRTPLGGSVQQGRRRTCPR